jgi:hypothetical protein
VTEYYPVLAAAALLFLSLVSWRLKRAAQPLRLEMAEVGERLLANPTLSPHMKNYVAHMLQTAFSFRLELLALIIGIPFVGLVLLFAPRIFAAELERLRVFDSVAKADLVDLNRLHHKISMANNPILFTVILIESAVIIPLGSIILTVFHGSIPPEGNVDTIIAIFQRKNWGDGNWLGA